MLIELKDQQTVMRDQPDPNDQANSMPRARDRRPLRETPRAQPSRTKIGSAWGERLNAFGWAATGFIVGAVFWHAVGFWDFVSHAVLNSDPTARANPTAAKPAGAAWQAAVRADPQQPKIVAGVKKYVPAAAATPSAPAANRDCNQAAIDRTSGQTTVLPCSATAALPVGAAGDKVDQMAVAQPAPPVSGIRINPDGSAVADWNATTVRGAHR